MRRKICTVLYKLGLRRAAHYVSPSIYYMLMGKEAAKYFMQAFPDSLNEPNALQHLAKLNQIEEGQE